MSEAESESHEPSMFSPVEAGTESRMHRFTHRAMACEFELALMAEDRLYAGQAAQEAFDQIDRLELQLSRFVPTSEVSRINTLKAGRALRVGSATLDCVKLACELYAETDGAFDLAVRSKLASGAPGMTRLGLDLQRHCVGVTEAGVYLDLGGIGKGYALDQTATLLRDWSIDSALIHSGQSTVLAIGAPPGQETWKIAMRDPTATDENPLGHVCLRNQAVSGSGTDQQGHHILDPRTGEPAEAKLGTWAVHASAAMSDALSTAFMILTAEEVQRFCEAREGVGGMLLQENESERLLQRFGAWPGC